VLGEDGFSDEGLSFVFAAPAEDRIATLVSTLLDHGATLAGDQALEAWRVLQGHPLAGPEPTEDHNPLEAGLREAVSFTKGCYVGQEVVARLNTYDKVSRLLTGLELPRGASVPPPGTEIRFRDREAGVVCSALLPPGHAAPVALAYLRREAATAGTVVQLGSKASTETGTAVVRDLPFTTVP
jgi:folate-binding protein YgfZ